MDDVTLSRWYAVYVRSRYEKKVHQLLMEQQVTSFVPLIEVMRQWSDRKKKVAEPLFRGYVFVNIEYRKESISVLDTDGVVKFIGIGRTPSIIADREIDWLKRLVREPGAITGTVNTFPAGQRVKVLAGPFKDFEGVIVRAGREARLVVFFDSIMQGVEVTIFADYLAPLGKTAGATPDPDGEKEERGRVERHILGL